MLNEALILLLKVCGRLASFFLLLLDLGLGEERFGGRELSEQDCLSNLCSSLDETSIAEWSLNPIEDLRGGMAWHIEEGRCGGTS
jgi:hypothetical protein